jgi:hypothetical protein
LLLHQGEGVRGEAKLPGRLDVTQTRGLSLDMWLTLDGLAPGQVLLDTRDEQGRGVALAAGANSTVRLDLHDGKTAATWDTDPGLLRLGTLHHLVAIVDAGPKIITFVVDGVLCDGGDARQAGWGRYRGELGDVAGTGRLRVTPAVRSVRLYGRPLRSSEAIAAFHAGP